MNKRRNSTMFESQRNHIKDYQNVKPCNRRISRVFAFRELQKKSTNSQNFGEA
jgi:hypothetical protein